MNDDDDEDDVYEEGPVREVAKKSAKNAKVPPSKKTSKSKAREVAEDEDDPAPATDRRLRSKTVTVPTPVKKSASKKAKGKAPVRPPPSPTPYSSRGAATSLSAGQRTLSDRALEIYEGLLPSSVFVTDPDAARLLATRAPEDVQVRSPSFYPLTALTLLFLVKTTLLLQRLSEGSQTLRPILLQEVRQVPALPTSSRKLLLDC